MVAVDIGAMASFSNLSELTYLLTGGYEVTGSATVSSASSTISGLSRVVGSFTSIVPTGAVTGAGGVPVSLLITIPMIVILVSVSTAGSVAGTDHVPPTAYW